MRRAAGVAAVIIGLAALALQDGRAQSADAIDAPRISMEDFKKLLAANNVDNGGYFTLSGGSDYVELDYAPEPGMGMLMLAGASVMLRRRRNRAAR